MKPNIAGIADILDIDDDLEIKELEIKEEKFEFNDDYKLDISCDYEFVRTKLRKSIAICETVVGESLKSIAIDKSPKAIDACASVIKMMINASKELQEMHDKQLKINKKQESSKIPANGDADDDKGGVGEKTLNEIIEEINEIEK